MFSEVHRFIGHFEIVSFGLLSFHEVEVEVKSIYSQTSAQEIEEFNKVQESEKLPHYQLTGLAS
jgi:hypothetical protein